MGGWAHLVGAQRARHVRQAGVHGAHQLLVAGAVRVDQLQQDQVEVVQPERAALGAAAEPYEHFDGFRGGALARCAPACGDWET